MTPEELMKPRYKVIADYPTNQYQVGDVLIRPETFNHFRVANKDGTGYGIDYSRDGLYLEEIEKYPHLFKKLEWWEERNVEDMPEYVKAESEVLQVVEVYKISGYETNIFGEFFGKTPDSATEKIFIRNADAMPATKEEYEQSLHVKQ